MGGVGRGSLGESQRGVGEVRALRAAAAPRIRPPLSPSRAGGYSSAAKLDVCLPPCVASRVSTLHWHPRSSTAIIPSRPTLFVLNLVSGAHAALHGTGAGVSHRGTGWTGGAVRCTRLRLCCAASGERQPGTPPVAASTFRWMPGPVACGRVLWGWPALCATCACHACCATWRRLAVCRKDRVPRRVGSVPPRPTACADRLDVRSGGASPPAPSPAAQHRLVAAAPPARRARCASCRAQLDRAHHGVLHPQCRVASAAAWWAAPAAASRPSCSRSSVSSP